MAYSELEQQLQPELQFAHHQACARDASEISAGAARIETAQIGVVRRVERLEAELQAFRFGEDAKGYWRCYIQHYTHQS